MSLVVLSPSRATEPLGLMPNSGTDVSSCAVTISHNRNTGINAKIAAKMSLVVLSPSRATEAQRLMPNSVTDVSSYAVSV